MGTLFNPASVASGFRDESLVNAINAAIKTALTDTVSRSGTSPNAMAADLDLGTNQLLNVAEGVLGTDGVNLNQVQNVATQIANTIIASVVSGGTGSSNANPITINYGVATGSQGTGTRTIFDLESLFGVTALNGLTVIVEGATQTPGTAYSLTGLVVTFTESLNADTSILFVYGDISPLPTVALATVDYDLGVYLPTAPTADQVIMRFVSPVDLSFADDFASSRLDAETAATASTVFDVNVEGVTVGTITVAISGTTGTFVTTGGAVTVNAGEVIDITAPTTPDATLAGISITLKGLRT